jgi:hypothetical protein
VLASAMLAAQEAPPKGHGRNVHALIELEHPTYHVGDSIRVRASLTNISNDTIWLDGKPPWRQVRLLVTGRDGQPVKKRWEEGGGGTGTVVVRLAPHQTVVQAWNGQDWLRLEGWGYDLRAPGHYTIVGIPVVTGMWVEADWRTVRSNRATFTIVP